LAFYSTIGNSNKSFSHLLCPKEDKFVIVFSLTSFKMIEIIIL